MGWYSGEGTERVLTFSSLETELYLLIFTDKNKPFSLLSFNKITEKQRTFKLS